MDRFASYLAPQRSLPLLLLLFAFVFFGYHAVFGERGLFALKALEARLAALEEERAALERERLPVERRVALLRSGSLDPDVLEEQALVFGLGRPEAIVITLDPLLGPALPID